MGPGEGRTRGCSRTTRHRCETRHVHWSREERNPYLRQRECRVSTSLLCALPDPAQRRRLQRQWKVLLSGRYALSRIAWVRKARVVPCASASAPLAQRQPPAWHGEGELAQQWSGLQGRRGVVAAAPKSSRC